MRTHTRSDVRAAIYGQVLASSEVVALSLDKSLDSAAILAGLAGTVLVFWLAHIYARTIADRVLEDSPTHGKLGAVMRFEWPIVEAAAPAAIALTLGIVGVLSTKGAVDLAVALGAANLFVWGVAIARRLNLGTASMLAMASTSAALGLAVVALKVVIH